jgi:hypothetical protein
VCYFPIALSVTAAAVSDAVKEDAVYHDLVLSVPDYMYAV